MPMRQNTILLLLITTVLHPAGPSAQQFSDPERSRKLATAFDDIDRMFTEFAKTSRVPGAASR